MKTFYLKTDKFWIISRILLTIILIVALIKIFIDLDFEPENLVAYSIFGIYISLMIIILLKKAFKKPVPSTIKLITGIISLLFGFLMSYSIFTTLNDFNKLQKIGFHIFPVWIILSGLRDILFYQNNFRVEKHIIKST